jgi:hypothetical protein
MAVWLTGDAPPMAAWAQLALRPTAVEQVSLFVLIEIAYFRLKGRGLWLFRRRESRDEVERDGLIL